MAATVEGILLFGNTAGRPAAGSVVVGTLYSDTEAGIVYQSNGSTWDTYATLGGVIDWGETGDIVASTIGGSNDGGALDEVARADHKHGFPSAASITAALDYGESGDITATNVGDTAAAGATGEVADAGHRHARLTDTGVINYIIDGGGSAITTGVKGDLYCPFGFTITEVTLLADQSGSIVIDIWKDTYANYPPTDADSITASAPPTISTATKSQDSTLTGWTTSVSAGQSLRFNVDSVTSITRVTLAIKYTRTS